MTYKKKQTKSVLSVAKWDDLRLGNPSIRQSDGALETEVWEEVQPSECQGDVKVLCFVS